MVASGGWGTLIFSYVGSDHFAVCIFFYNFNIFLGFQINEYFSGMKMLWIFLRGHHKLDKLGGISMYFWVSSKGSGTEFGIFLGC